MLAKAWTLAKDTVSGFLADDALSRAAAIAYFTIFSIAPLLIVVTAIAGLVFGYEAAQKAIVAQFSGLVGPQSGEILQSMIAKAAEHETGLWATLLGGVTLLIAASGAFGEIQSSLNKIWKAKPAAGLSRMVRARLAGLGLVLTLGFLMVVSLVVSAALSALGHWVEGLFAGAQVAMIALNFVISLALLSAVFAAIFKLLPDTPIAWRDVAIGAVATALLFTIGKTAIALYIGKTHIASGFGAAGSLIVMLVWIYYSSLIFLLGAEFTRAFAEQQGSHAGEGEPAAAAAAAAEAKPAAEPAPATPLPSEILLARTDIARANIDETWRQIRARIPNPALPDEIGRRPSLLQLAVAGLAVLTLPPRLREEAPFRRRGEHVQPPPITHSRVGAPTAGDTAARRAAERVRAG